MFAKAPHESCAQAEADATERVISSSRSQDSAQVSAFANLFKSALKRSICTHRSGSGDLRLSPANLQKGRPPCQADAIQGMRCTLHAVLVDEEWGIFSREGKKKLRRL